MCIPLITITRILRQRWEMNKRTEQNTLQENANHGDIFLPVSHYHCLIPVTYRELALHWHKEMEITLVREGMSDYRVGNKTFRAKRGDIILIPPYSTHSACEILDTTMISDSLVFHPDLIGAKGQDLSAIRYLRPLAEGQLKMSELIQSGDPEYEQIRESFLKALDCFITRPPFWEMKLKAALLHIVILLFDNDYIREPDEGQHDLSNRLQIKTTLQYIAEHYTERIKVSVLADLSGFSESYFMDLFRQYVGMSCIQYINHYRIQKAAHALEKTAKSVTEVALDQGFNNISYFNLQFRREFGMTPRQFRKRQECNSHFCKDSAVPGGKR